MRTCNMFCYLFSFLIFFFFVDWHYFGLAERKRYTLGAALYLFLLRCNLKE